MQNSKLPENCTLQPRACPPSLFCVRLLLKWIGVCIFSLGSKRVRGIDLSLTVEKSIPRLCVHIRNLRSGRGNIVARIRLVIFGSDDTATVYRNGFASPGHDPRFMGGFSVRYITQRVTSRGVRLRISSVFASRTAKTRDDSYIGTRDANTDNNRDSNNIIAIRVYMQATYLFNKDRGHWCSESMAFVCRKIRSFYFVHNDIAANV